MDAVTSVAAQGSPTTGAGSRQSLGPEDFLSIMLSELANQDPLEPLDNSQFLNQLTQMQSLEATTKLTEGIEALLLGQQISSAGSLLGQQVQGVLADGTLMEGRVDRVVVAGGQVQLGVGDSLLPMSSIRQISSVAA
ncbi:MAG: flagellar hook assembly protein FlgD [Planctomycetota bacterium]